MVIVSGLLSKTIRSTTFRLALALIVVFGTIVVAFLGYIYISAVAEMQSEFDRALAADRRSIEIAYQRAGRAGAVAEIQRHLSDGAFGRFYLLTNSSFDVLAGNLPSWPRGLRTADADASTFVEWSDMTRPSPMRALAGVLPNGDRLLLGQKLDGIAAFRANGRNALIATLVLLLVLTAVASVAVTRRTIGRIEAINATSRGIIQSDLKQRIPLRGSNDEWDQVAGNLNLMLDRIERLMGELRQVTDNVAHDLRTPLTRIRGRLEKALNQPGANDCHHELFGDTIADLDVVLGVFSSLTRISQIETNIQRSAFRPVILFDVAAKAVELYEAAAEESATRLTLLADRTLSVMGDQDLLFDAICNLLDNAIKHGRAGGNVTVEAANTNGRQTISVTDDGPGIPEREYSEVLKRFYRLERSRTTPGNGLGLSLIAAVAHIHGAEIKMSDNSPGLRVELSFPSSASRL